jgi:hydroxyacylglutathione hydrolase
VKRLADGVYQLRGFPPNGINVYLMGDVIVDAATKFAPRRILRQVREHRVTGHALTHAHPDHQGASKALCDTLGIPLMCGEGDVEAMETGNIRDKQPKSVLNTLIDRMWTGPPHKVDRVLHEGDNVAGFKVIEVPGHSAGHVAYFREADRVLILGDVLNNQDLRTGITGLHEPPKMFTPDPARNRDSARKLAALEPSIIAFGHGPVLTDGKKFTDFVAKLAS